MYIHELQDWPRFEWNREQLAELLAEVRHRQGRRIGHMEALGFELRQEAVLETLTADVLKSSEIEGEKLDAEQVRSSIARRLGMEIGGLERADRNVEGVVEMMLDATRRYDPPLTAARLCREILWRCPNATISEFHRPATRHRLASRRGKSFSATPLG